MADESNSTCDCQTCPQDIRILLDGTFQGFANTLEYHAASYEQENPHIQISFEVVDNLQDELLEPRNWDGTVFPAQLVGQLVKEDILWDLNNFVGSSLSLDWSEVLPFFRHRFAGFGSVLDDDAATATITTRMVPLDGDVLSMYYRRDLFQEYNMTIPRTWDEYNEAASFFHGKTIGPGGSAISGSCVARVDNCSNAYWTSMVLATMTQAMGTSSGFFLDPETLDPLFGSAMEETLRLLSEQFRNGHEDELEGDCLTSNFAFNQGKCALTYNWGNQITVSGTVYDIGAAPTPGSQKILDRETGELVNCSLALCPHATYYDDIGLVNTAPYAAFGGWAAGVSNAASEGKQYAAADFFAYVSNSQQSLTDVLPNPRSNFAQPYRYSHVTSSNWIEDGFDSTLASEYTEAVRHIDSENSVVELRVPPARSMRKVVDQEVYNYLFVAGDPTISPEADLLFRQEFTDRMETRIQGLLDAENGFSPLSYRESIGRVYVPHIESRNYIEDDFRDAAFGLSGLMCVVSFVLMIWTIRHRNNRVMKAFQPFLLVNSSIGLLLLSASIIPLGFDETWYDVEILDYTCMLAPWLYVVGFTIFFSSVYCKILESLKIYREPHKHEILLVQPGSALRLGTRLLILNGTILGLWTGLDPLVWERREVDGGDILADGTVETYGACHGGYPALGFALSLYTLNMLISLIASIQAFKCRFLLLEYNEMQWLPLSVFPFLQVWAVGAPVLAFVGDKPTVTFIVLSMMIVLSTVAAGMAVFAPKDWYVRKYYHSHPELNRKFPERTTSAGILVLKHPTVESQKQLEELCFRLEQMEGWNTELEIEIRVMKDQFKELTTSEKFHLRESLLNAAIADAESPDYSRSRGVEEYEHTEISQSNDEELAVVEQFQSVWKMPDEDEEEETTGALVPIPEPNSFSSGQDDHSGTDGGVIATNSTDGSENWRGQSSFRGQPARMDSRSSSTEPEDPLQRIMRMHGDEDDSDIDEPRDYGDQEDYGYDRHGDSPQDPLARLARLEESDDSPAVLFAGNNGDDSDDYPLASGGSIDDSLEGGPQDPRAVLVKVDYGERHQEQAPSDRMYKDRSPERSPVPGVYVHNERADDSRDRQGNIEYEEAQSFNDVPEDPLLRIARMDASDERPSDPLVSTDDSDDGPQDPLLRVGGYDDSDESGPKDPLLLIASMGDDDTDSGPKDPLLRLASMGDESDETDSGPKDPLAVLASMEDGDDNDDTDSGPKDPLALIAAMGDDDESEEEDASADIIAKIIAMRLAAVDNDDGEEENDGSMRSSPEDPLAKLDQMMAEEEAAALADVPTVDLSSDSDEDEDAMIKKSDFRDLSSMIQEDDLAELERKALLLAESLKSKLVDSTLADISRDTRVDVSTDSDMGYIALAKGAKEYGFKQGINGLDISKISTEDERNFVSMSDSILDSPGRSPAQQSPELLTPRDSSDGSTQSPIAIAPSAGESSADVKDKDTMANVMSAMQNLDGDFLTQNAGEPSQGDWRETRERQSTTPAGKKQFGTRSPLNVKSPPVMSKTSPYNDYTSTSRDTSLANTSYSVSDWVAVGGVAGVLADFSDSQSTSSYAESHNNDSVSSMEATTRASALDTPLATELDHLVGKMDWDGVKVAAAKYETPVYEKYQTPAKAHNLSAIEEKRKKKREIEAWRVSLSKSFERSPDR